MRRIYSFAALSDALAVSPRPLGLVPTMGALHAGHLSLIRQAADENTTVVVTIFVNPAQFGPEEDFEHYPGSMESDLELLEQESVDFIFTPDVNEVYGRGFATTIHVGGPSTGLEGHARPTHFDGVATIVGKLLIHTRPEIAYFGQKDAQQVAVVNRLVSDLNISSAIAVLPTVRELDGLAVSSRNSYLNPSERAAAVVLFRSLAASRDRFRAGRQTKFELEESCRHLMSQEPLVTSVDYVSIVNPETFEPWTGAGPCIMTAAINVGRTRLIDNVILD